MAVTLISRILVRRGPKDNIPQQLAEGEFSFTTDTGELFIGAPNLPKVAHRQGTIFPYQNIRVLTEFDVVHTLHDHIVTTGPLMRVTAPTRTDDTNTFTYWYAGDPLDLTPSNRVIQLTFTGTGVEPGDLRGRVLSKAEFIRDSDGAIFTIPHKAFSVKHVAGSMTPNSFMVFDIDEAGLPGITVDDRLRVTFLNLDTIAEYPLAESNSFVMDYSMTSEVEVDGLKVRRTGTLTIAADEYSVAIVDQGVDLNQHTSETNIMRIVWSGHIDNSEGFPKVILTCTNMSYYPVSITFAGSRWAHNEEV